MTEAVLKPVALRVAWGLSVPVPHREGSSEVVANALLLPHSVAVPEGCRLAVEPGLALPLPLLLDVKQPLEEGDLVTLGQEEELPVALALLVALKMPLPVRVPEAQRVALGDLEADTLALVQRVEDPQGLLLPHSVGTALAVRDRVLVAHAVAHTLCVLQTEPVVDLLGLPEPVREDELQGLLEGDLVGEALLETQRVAVEDTLRVGLTLAHKLPEAETLSLTLAL